jgi:hypothetical protein
MIPVSAIEHAQNIPMSSPKKTIKPAPMAHYIFVALPGFVALFALSLFPFAASASVNKTNALRTLRENEIHGYSSPKNALKPAPMAHHIFVALPGFVALFALSLFRFAASASVDKTHALRTLRENEIHGYSSPKNALKSASMARYIFVALRVSVAVIYSACAAHF